MPSIQYTSLNFNAVHQFLHDNGITSSFNGTAFRVIHNNDGMQMVALLGNFTVNTYGYVTIT